MEDLWEKAGLKYIDTRVIRIPVVYSDFDDFWDSNTVLIGPQGKLIARMSTSEREQLRTDLRDRLPTASDGRIVYKSFANAVKGSPLGFSFWRRFSLLLLRIELNTRRPT